MKKILYFILCIFMFISCKPSEQNIEIKGINAFDTTLVDYFYNYAKVSVPAGINTLYVETYDSYRENVKVDTIHVKPIFVEVTDGKDVEPFGDVNLMFKSNVKTLVGVYYLFPSEENKMANIYVLDNFKVNKIKYGEFGETKYVQIPWDYSLGQLEDIYVYNEEHNHTLHYVYAYAKLGNGSGYVLSDMYNVNNGIITKDIYPNAAMPWDVDGFIGNGNIITSNAPARIPARTPANTDITTVVLPEPAPYVTTDDEYTFYHSSGCVFFEDSWPTINQGGVYDLDFNDCVIDYDFEARTVSDDKLETDAWREIVKVVIHLRAVGSDVPYRVGVKLHGFDQNNVASIEQHFTLDSYENPHGTLPAFTETTIQHNSGHYENDPMNPIVEMAHIFTMNQERAGVGANAEYTYTNGTVENNTVFNLCYGYKPMDAEQYKPELASITYPTTLANIQKKKWYNAIPGYINVAGGLITYTVIYHMNNRALMTPEEREAVKQNMIETVTNTTKQNFYIITKDFTPIGLKGYEPVLLHNQSVSKYTKKYADGLNDGSLNGSIPYCGTNGAVWGVKCPTLTRHIWNKLYFSQAYPHYQDWILSEGTNHAQWYIEDINDLYLTCWW